MRIAEMNWMQVEAHVRGDDRAVLPLPSRLLAAHGPQMPDGVGVALGFDRLVMLGAGARSIDAVRPFSSTTA